MIITPLENYPDNGKHLQCDIDIDYFHIAVGEDGYTLDNGKPYNLGKKTTKLWVVNIYTDAPDSLQKLFKQKTAYKAEVLVKYCYKIYKKWLQSELENCKQKIKSL